MNYRNSHFAIPWIRVLGGLIAAAVLGLVAAGTPAPAASLILNEYNAVGAGDYLSGGDYSDALDKEDAYFATIVGLPDGRIEGNGGNWIELVVVEDRLDIRGWSLRWAETGATDTDGNNLWYGDPDIEHGIISFSETALIWSDLRAGTIITISEKDAIGVDTDFDVDDNRYFTDTDDVAEADVDVTIDLSTDTSYDPVGGDWLIHVSTRQEQADGTLLVSTVTNVNNDNPGDFSVGPDDWEMTIRDLAGDHYGPIGEAIDDFGDFPGGISDREAGRLEADPAMDLDNDSYDDVTSTSFGQPNEWGGAFQDFSELRLTIDPHAGDADLDGCTDVADFNIWNANKFTSGTGWRAGNFNGDGTTDVRDFNIWNATKFTCVGDTAPLAEGQVPEPGGLTMVVIGAAAMVVFVRCRRSV